MPKRTLNPKREIYLARQLQAKDRIIHEREFFDSTSVGIILAEPGGGKSECLRNFARKTGGRLLRASLFKYSPPNAMDGVLILDALDEVTRLDTSAVHEIIAKAAQSGAHRVVFACRSAGLPDLAGPTVMLGSTVGM